MTTLFAGTASGSLAIAAILFRSTDITGIADTSAFGLAFVGLLVHGGRTVVVMCSWVDPDNYNFHTGSIFNCYTLFQTGKQHLKFKPRLCKHITKL
jgi:hypothetical protein